MNTLNTFETPGENPFVFNEKKLPEDKPEQPQQAPTESQWRRVLDVILVEGQIRYLVERGE